MPFIFNPPIPIGATPPVVSKLFSDHNPDDGRVRRDGDGYWKAHEEITYKFTVTRSRTQPHTQGRRHSTSVASRNRPVTASARTERMAYWHIPRAVLYCSSLRKRRISSNGSKHAGDINTSYPHAIWLLLPSRTIPSRARAGRRRRRRRARPRGQDGDFRGRGLVSTND